jgi:hypothetical protein
MNRFLQYSAVPPVLLGGVLALGVAFAWLAVLFTALAIFAPFSDPRVTLVLLFSPLILALDLFALMALHSPVWPAQFWDHDLIVFLPIFIATLLLAALFSVRCYRRQRRYSAHHTATWMLFVLLMGLPGLIGYLLHRRWPIVVRCQHCNAETPRDRDACLTCNTPFPLPAMKGIEVFA